MNINHLLSQSSNNFSIQSQSNISSQYSSTFGKMEHPLIMPLRGSTNTNLSKSHDLLSLSLLNQQLLVPVAAFQTANGESLPLVTAQLDSSTSSPNLLESAVKPLTQTSAGGMNLIVTKANSNSVPLITDSIPSQLLNQQFYIQSKSLLDQNISVQYTQNQNIIKNEKLNEETITSDLKTDSISKKIMELRSSISDSVNTVFVEADVRKDNYKVQRPQDTQTLVELSCNNTTTEIEPGSLSKVISSLPPGWKVVGLTHLTDSAQPTPVVEAHNNKRCSSVTASGNCTPYVPSPSHHHCGVPEVVSVDLNIPTTLSLSTDILNDSLGKKRLENIILPIDLSHISAAKSESCNETPNSTQIPFISSDNQCHVRIKQEVETEVKPDIFSELSQDKFDLDFAKNEWKVVGLTTSSLPSTSTTDNNSQMSNIALPFPLTLSPDLGRSTEGRSTNSRSQKAATILNVPMPKLIQHSATSLSSQQSTSLSSCSSEKLQWTIVGVTMAKTSNVANGNATTSVCTIKANSVNPDVNIRADCIVTDSQQRPVSSSESKNAPLSIETNQKGIDSTLIKDQWKVVGITHSTNDNQITSIPPINCQFPVPLSHIQQTFPITSVPTSMAINSNLSSNNSTISSPSTVNLSGNVSTLNSAMSFVTPPLLTTAGQNNSLLEQQQQLLLTLVQNQLHHQLQQQQEEHRQLMMSQIQSQLALQNQTPLVNSVKDWNLVGLLSNIPPTLLATGNQAEIKDLRKKKDTTHKSITINSTSQNIEKEELVPRPIKIAIKPEGPLSDSKKNFQSRCKAFGAKFTKKNTVSHLLKLKRMKMKAEGGDDLISHSDHEGFEVDKNMKQVKDHMALLNKSDKVLRSRPLHSYAGNRKIFSKSSSSRKDEGNERINLRSGNQVPVNDFDFDPDKKDWSEEMDMPSADEPDKIEVLKESSPVSETRSSARKRKLKVPRKIADVDYQPFDSSSDSN